MKAISIWQPFAQLLVTGNKVFETRTWPASQSLIGTRIGIASTKVIRPEQRQWVQQPFFAECYERTLLPPLEELLHGYLLGTVILDSVELMTEEFIADVSDEEQAYGHWQIGNYAWRMSHQIPLITPVPIRGMQGLFELNANAQAPEHSGPAQDEAEQGGPSAPHRLQGAGLGQSVEEAPALRSHLRVVR